MISSQFPPQQTKTIPNHSIREFTAKDSTLVRTFLGDSLREFISLLVMEGILENQIETFLQVFRALGNQIKMLFFLKKRNDLRGKCEGQLVFLPRSLHGEISTVCGL